MMSLYRQWIQYIVDNQLFAPGNKILLGVSGGMDSVVMLDLFLRLSKEWPIRLGVVHVNHQLRAPFSDEDERFVRNLSRKLRIPFYSLQRDVQCYCRDHRVSLEMGARTVRFEFFNQMLNRLDYDYVAVAHHADDQAETVVMHLLQGSGLRGLRGILPKRKQVIHPILFITKTKVKEYAIRKSLDYVVDRTNYDVTHVRNFIRWKILKLLKQQIGLSVIDSICHTASIVREYEDYSNHMARQIRDDVIISQSRKEIVLDINQFLRYFTAVQKTLLIQIFEEFFLYQRNLRVQEIKNILHLIKKGKSGSLIQIDKEYTVARTHQYVSLIRNTEALSEISVQIGKKILLHQIGLQFCATLLDVDRPEISFTKNRRVEYLDFESISKPLTIRSMKPGDRFIPLGMKGKKKLHDFFIDEKVPFYRRSNIPLLVCNDHIVWVMGYRIDDRFRLCNHTKRILKVEIKHMTR